MEGYNDTDGEITLYTPDGRAMLSVEFWDPDYDHKPARDYADQLRADALLIVEALNAHRRVTRWWKNLLGMIR